MKKVMYDQFGGVDVLKMAEVSTPAMQDDTLLIRVKAVSINPLDWKMREGAMKMMTGSKFPRGTGIDFAGIVEQVGSAVGKYKKGDEVFGLVDAFKGAALAEYVVVTEKEIALKPENISFEQAAALPVVGLAALQIFNQLVSVGRGTEVLINGATGGIGMLAIQIAKSRGAIVTSVAGPKGMAMAKKWGSDYIIDYHKEDVLKGSKQFDVVLDLSTKMPFKAAKRLMKPVSAYVNAVPGPKEIIGSFLHNLFSKQKYRVLLLKPSAAGLESLVKQTAGGMEVVIGATYPISAFRQAYAEVSKGSLIGKAVFTVA